MTKKKLTLSIISVLAIVALMVGATMAWFTDAERVNANFEAGILDIAVGTKAELAVFENLRPMANTDTFMNEINAVLADPDYYVGKGYNPTPVYVQEFAISNLGTLPARIRLAISDAVPEDQISNIVDNGIGGVKIGDPALIDCGNELGKAYDALDAAFSDENNDLLTLVLLQKNASGTAWTLIDEFTLSELKAGYTLQNAAGDADLILNAGESSTTTYALGAYLNSAAGNVYQAKHYHALLNVYAAQVDEGAVFGPEVATTPAP